MLGLVLIYFVGKAFYDLAGLHGKSQWGFGILGVVSYYFGIVVGGAIVGILYEIFSDNSIDNIPDIALSAMALPLGVASCWGFYLLLKRLWTKQRIRPKVDEVLDRDLIS